MKLYDIAMELREALDKSLEAVVTTEDGEIVEDEQVETVINGLYLDYNDTLEGVACYIKELEEFADGLARRKKVLDERKRQTERRIESLKRYLTTCMTAVGQTTFETVDTRISFRRSEAVETVDELVPSEYKTVKMTEAVDKAKIKMAIKHGQEVPGATLVVRNNIQIR